MSEVANEVSNTWQPAPGKVKTGAVLGYGITVTASALLHIPGTTAECRIIFLFGTYCIFSGLGFEDFLFSFLFFTKIFGVPVQCSVIQ